MQAEEFKLGSFLPIVHGRSMSSGAMGGGQSRHSVHSTVNGLGDGHCNRTRISHRATLLGVAEVAMAALLVLVIDLLKEGLDATGIGTFTWNHSLT